MPSSSNIPTSLWMPLNYWFISYRRSGHGRFRRLTKNTHFAVWMKLSPSSADTAGNRPPHALGSSSTGNICRKAMKILASISLAWIVLYHAADVTGTERAVFSLACQSVPKCMDFNNKLKSGVITQCPQTLTVANYTLSHRPTPTVLWNQ